MGKQDKEEGRMCRWRAKVIISSRKTSPNAFLYICKFCAFLYICTFCAFFTFADKSLHISIFRNATRTYHKRAGARPIIFGENESLEATNITSVISGMYALIYLSSPKENERTTLGPDQKLEFFSV